MSSSTFHLNHVSFAISQPQPFQAELLGEVGAQKRSSSSPVDLPARQNDPFLLFRIEIPFFGETLPCVFFSHGVKKM